MHVTFKKYAATQIGFIQTKEARPTRTLDIETPILREHLEKLVSSPTTYKQASNTEHALMQCLFELHALEKETGITKDKKALGKAIQEKLQELISRFMSYCPELGSPGPMTKTFWIKLLKIFTKASEEKPQKIGANTLKEVWPNILSALIFANYINTTTVCFFDNDLNEKMGFNDTNSDIAGQRDYFFRHFGSQVSGYEAFQRLPSEKKHALADYLATVSTRRTPYNEGPPIHPLAPYLLILKELADTEAIAHLDAFITRQYIQPKRAIPDLLQFAVLPYVQNIQKLTSHAVSKWTFPKPEPGHTKAPCMFTWITHMTKLVSQTYFRESEETSVVHTIIKALDSTPRDNEWHYHFERLMLLSIFNERANTTDIMNQFPPELLLDFSHHHDDMSTNRNNTSSSYKIRMMCLRICCALALAEPHHSLIVGAIEEIGKQNTETSGFRNNLPRYFFSCLAKTNYRFYTPIYLCEHTSVKDHLEATFKVIIPQLLTEHDLPVTYISFVSPPIATPETLSQWLETFGKPLGLLTLQFKNASDEPCEFTTNLSTLSQLLSDIYLHMPDESPVTTLTLNTAPHLQNQTTPIPLSHPPTITETPEVHPTIVPKKNKVKTRGTNNTPSTVEPSIPIQNTDTPQDSDLRHFLQKIFDQVLLTPPKTRVLCARLSECAKDFSDPYGLKFDIEASRNSRHRHLSISYVLANGESHTIRTPMGHDHSGQLGLGLLRRIAKEVREQV